MAGDDQSLLREYVENSSEEAFSELLNRHLNLVYCAALRQVRSPQLAEEVAQSVFFDLAQHARSLRTDTVLSAWLFQVTRRTAIDVVRRESRRQQREQIAMDLNRMNAEPSDWSRIEPLIDEALAALEEPDRTAILLRFFEHKSLREVGSILGTSEDAAQKRVSRALARLQQLLSERGAGLGVASLAAVLTSNAVVQAAPASLAAAILSGAGLASAAVQTTTSVTIVMTTLQKTILAATFTALVGTSLLQTHRVSELQEANQSLERRNVELTAKLHEDSVQLQARLAAAQGQIDLLQRELSELPKLRGELAQRRREAQELARLKAEQDGALSLEEREMRQWLFRVNLLRQKIEEWPHHRIPEFQFLNELNWLSAARAALSNEEDFRKAFASLRHAGENQFIMKLHGALQKYLTEHGGEFPRTLADLNEFFDAPVSSEMLARYHIIPAADLPQLRLGGEWIITSKDIIDPEHDQRWGIGPNGYGSGGRDYPDDVKSAMKELKPAVEAFEAAYGHRGGTDPSQIEPFLTTPAQRKAYETLLKQMPAAGRRSASMVRENNSSTVPANEPTAR